jgi:hypothetical protein
MSTSAGPVRNVGLTVPLRAWPVLALAVTLLYALAFDGGVSRRHACVSLVLHPHSGLSRRSMSALES